MRCTPEFYTLSQDAADTLNSVKAAGGRIIAVEQPLFEHWKQSAINTMVNSKPTVAGPISLSNQATTSSQS